MNIHTSKTEYLEAEIKRLHEANQAMLEALEGLLKNPNSNLYHNIARAAIAKGEQQ